MEKTMIENKYLNDCKTQSQDENCPMCGKNPTITELIDYEEFCEVRW